VKDWPPQTAMAAAGGDATLKNHLAASLHINCKVGLVSRKKPQESQRNRKLPALATIVSAQKNSLMENLFIENKGFVYYDFK
jgi:hypothetical protein